MLDDRMEPENIKDVAAGIMEQAPSASTGADAVGSGHPDRPFARNLFTESNSGLPEQTSQPSFGGLDLSAFSAAPASGAGGSQIREDLVQQAAQALVRDQNDAFLAVTKRMTPDEVGVSLSTARQWRRPDPDWQQSFQSAPETQFSFIDRKKPDKGSKKKKPNKAEALASKIVQYMRQNNLGADDAAHIVRQATCKCGLSLSEQQVSLFAAKVSRLL